MLLSEAACQEGEAQSHALTQMKRSASALFGDVTQRAHYGPAVRDLPNQLQAKRRVTGGNSRIGKCGSKIRRKRGIANWK